MVIVDVILTTMFISKRLDNGRYIILLLYVDGMLVARSSMQDINVLKRKIAKSFVMKNLGAAKKNWYENRKRQEKL